MSIKDYQDNQDNQQFVTKRPKIGDTFIFKGIKIVAAPLTNGEPCTGCYGTWQLFCSELPLCCGIVWKKATIQETDTGQRTAQASEKSQASQASQAVQAISTTAEEDGSFTIKLSKAAYERMFDALLCAQGSDTNEQSNNLLNEIVKDTSRHITWWDKEEN